MTAKTLPSTPARNTVNLMAPQFSKSRLITASLVLAYFGSFFTRTQLIIVSTPLKRVGLVDDATYGLINAVSYAANAFSKPLSGVMLDTLKSPKFTFIAMMMTTIVLALMNTVLVAPWNFVMFFAAIKFLSAFGKPGVLKIASQWWPFEAMGRISGLMTGGGANTGEAVSRLILGSLILTFGDENWRYVYYIGGAVSFLLLMPAIFIARDRPSEPIEGVKTPHLAASAKPLDSVETDKSNSQQQVVEKKDFMRDTVLPLATNPRFWFVAGMAFTSTACRESLLCYTSKYYEKVFQASSGLCAMIPAIINIASAISVISGGFVFDKIPKKNRGLVMSIFFGAASAMFLVLLTFTKVLIANDSASGSNVIVASVLIFITALFLCPPNSFLDGVCAVDLSGPKGVAFASGIISAFGYAGSVCVSVVFGQLLGEGATAWPTLWGIVALLAGTSSVIALLYWMFEVRRLSRLQRQIEVEKFMKSLQAKA